MTNYKCPKHNVALRGVEDYPGALVHDGCRGLYAVIAGQLCLLDGGQWKDTKTGEIRIASEVVEHKP